MLQKRRRNNTVCMYVGFIMNKNVKNRPLIINYYSDMSDNTDIYLSRFLCTQKE